MNLFQTRIALFLTLLGLCASAISLLITFLALICNIIYMKINDIEEDNDQIVLITHENFFIKWIFIITLIVYLYKSGLLVLLPA